MIIDERELYPYTVTDTSNHDAIIIAPHPDDESIGCGGSIIKHRNSGSRVKVVFITDGDRGDFEGRFGDRYVHLRRQCTEKAMKILGVNDYEFCGYRDRETYTAIDEITERLKEIINKFSPSIIYVPSPYEVHPDHRVISNIALRIQEEMAIDLLYYEVAIALCPNILIDITNEMQRKREAIKAYSTELQYNDYLTKIEGLNRFRTITLPEEIKFAEGFILCKHHPE